MFVSSQTAVKGGHGFEILQSGWIICAAKAGARYIITHICPSCLKYALEIKLVFGYFYVFDIANTEIQN